MRWFETAKDFVALHTIYRAVGACYVKTLHKLSIAMTTRILGEKLVGDPIFRATVINMVKYILKTQSHRDKDTE
jgi:hypothetical protein